MEWNLDKNKPICPQICEKFCVLIASGEIKPGEKLVSVREVALDAGVNPNTVQKSFEELERKQIINSVRSVGWYVSDDISQALIQVESLKKAKVAEFITSMEALGTNAEQAIEYIRREIK
ncbi:MAG: GntR family transcriptional regulator [Clostridiales bacterium]|nr:GntR family transcriptional regulator [Clostridiales bacterium]